jgi:hypothetical protein
MALLGVILLLAGAGVGVVAYLATRGAAGPVTVTAFGFSRDASPIELVLYGAVAVLLFALGWALLSASARRRARLRREERASARISEVEESAETARLEHERRFEEAGLRDDDLRRRESELAARHEGLDTREAELARREAEWREREGPSRADVVTGRAEGSVADGTATWADDERTAAGTHSDRTQQLPATERPYDQEPGGTGGTGDTGDTGDTVDPAAQRGDGYDRDERRAHRDTTA